MKGIFILDTGIVLRRYTKEFDELDSISKSFITNFFETSNFILAPHVLAEIDGKLEKRTALIAALVECIKKIKEESVGKESILESDALKKFGVVDTAIALLAKRTGFNLVTVDWALRNWCTKNDIPCVHIDELIFRSPNGNY